MSGLLRNLLTLLMALRHWRSVPPLGRTSAWFFITPLDTGIATLKSDKYLQLAESAQVDFIIKTGLLPAMRRQGCAFVNLAQQVRFAKPVKLFDRVRVDTHIAFADAKHAWFQHTVYRGPDLCAQVLVKMKFKRGALTVAPAQFIGEVQGPAPPSIQAWEQTLAQPLG